MSSKDLILRANQCPVVLKEETILDGEILDPIETMVGSGTQARGTIGRLMQALQGLEAANESLAATTAAIERDTQQIRAVDNFAKKIHNDVTTETIGEKETRQQQDPPLPPPRIPYKTNGHTNGGGH
jgi:hypothetical protein